MSPLAAAPPTHDRLLGGSVALWQPSMGHRTTTDTILLAAFAARGRKSARVLDLGAGAGAVTLVLSRLGYGQHFVLWDRDPVACRLAERNVRDAELSARVIQRDVSEGVPADLRGQSDLVVLNPPYFEPGHARAPERAPEAAIGALLPFLSAARDALARRGRVALCYPARSLSILLAHAERCALFAKRLRAVHAYPDRDARLALVEFKPGRPGGMSVEPPLVEWTAKGVPSEELRRLTLHQADDPTGLQRLHVR